MANQQHLDLLQQGKDIWNQWRREHQDTRPNLSRANFSGTNLMNFDLSVTDLSEANLSRANLSGAQLWVADLREANLSGAKLIGTLFSGADLTRANLSDADLTIASFRMSILREADLRKAKLVEAILQNADLSGANLSDADLSQAMFVRTDLRKAKLTNCRVYGMSVWDVQLEEAEQLSLIITPDLTNQPNITVDNLEIAQFIYLLLNNKKIRDVIDTITSKVVLILGRFTPERKIVLDAIKEELRKRNYTPVLFDFEKPANRDLTETVSTLAHLARFIIVDLTDPSSAPHEVAIIIPHCIVPVQPLLTLQPLIIEGKVVERHEYGMFQDLRRRHPWVLPTFRYKDTTDLLASVKENIIEPAEQKAKELAQ